MVWASPRMGLNSLEWNEKRNSRRLVELNEWIISHNKNLESVDFYKKPYRMDPLCDFRSNRTEASGFIYEQQSQ